MIAVVDGRPEEVMYHDSGERVTLEVRGRQYGFFLPNAERNRDGSVPEAFLRAYVTQAVRLYREEAA